VVKKKSHSYPKVRETPILLTFWKTQLNRIPGLLLKEVTPGINPKIHLTQLKGQVKETNLGMELRDSNHSVEITPFNRTLEKL